MTSAGGIALCPHSVLVRRGQHQHSSQAQHGSQHGSQHSSQCSSPQRSQHSSRQGLQPSSRQGSQEDVQDRQQVSQDKGNGQQAKHGYPGPFRELGRCESLAGLDHRQEQVRT